MGRAALNLDEKQIENYAKLGASNCEIAGMLGCSEGTIRTKYADVLLKARSLRKTILRKYQWEAVKAGNIAMLIWLGKNELGQTDTMKHTGADVAAGEKPVSVTLRDAMRDDPDIRRLADQLGRALESKSGANGRGTVSREMVAGSTPGAN